MSKEINYKAITKDLIELLKSYTPADEHIIYDLASLGWGYDTIVALGFDMYMVEKVMTDEANGVELL